MPRPKKLRPPKRHERAWHQGTVKEIRPGVWRAWRERVHHADGAVSRPSKIFKGPKAEDRAKVWAAGAVEPEVMTLAIWLDRWLALREPIVRPATRRNYRTHVKACLKLAWRPLAELTSDDLQGLANELLGLRSWNTVRNWRAIISSSLRAAVPRYIPHNPMQLVKLPKPVEQPPKAWQADEVSHLVATAIGRKHEAWLWTMLGTGMRVGESRALRRTDLDFTTRTVTISKTVDSLTNKEGPTKSGKTRIVDLPDEVIEILTAHLARLPVGERYVFGSGKAGGPVLVRSFQSWIAALVAKSGVTVHPVHSLRHTFATLSLEAGVPLKEVSEALGHASVAITANIYTHAVNARQRRAADAMGAVLKNRPIRRIGTDIGTRSAV